MSCDWLELPREITRTILQKVGAVEILKSAQLVCSHWRDICTEPSTWTTIIAHFSWRYGKLHVDNMIRHAVDRSCGHLFDLDFDKSFSTQLLHDIVERCTQIRRLRTAYLTDLEVEKVAANLLLLEDLEIWSGALSSKAIETLGRSCSRLRSLKIHVDGDKEAKTIARSMPQLRHICFAVKNIVTYVGVEALLDGCPLLESLVMGIQQLSTHNEGTFQMMKKKLDVPSTWSTIRVNIKTLPVMPDDDIDELEGVIRQVEDLQHLKNVIRLAVDKSCGGLVDVDLGIFMSRDILSYVVKRCNQIRRLRGNMSLDCSEKAIRAAAARLPLLEDLELVYYGNLSVETIETLGRCCPRLTSLKIPITDDGAETLARSLPQLRDLKPGKQLTDVGVEALLDGCTHLESLDLLECHLVELDGYLRIRCFQQIKHLQIPRHLLQKKKNKKKIKKKTRSRR